MSTISYLVTLIQDMSAPQDLLYYLQQQTDDVLIWNGYDNVFNRLEAQMPKVKEYFETLGAPKEDISVDFSDDKTLEISHRNFICWSAHPLIFAYFGKDKKKHTFPPLTREVSQL